MFFWLCVIFLQILVIETPGRKVLNSLSVLKQLYHTFTVGEKMQLMLPLCMYTNAALVDLLVLENYDSYLYP